MYKRYITVAAAFLLLISGCSSTTTLSSKSEELYIFAAASLKGLMDNVKQQYEKEYPETEIVLNYAGTHVLKTQIEQGAKVDLFIAAREKDVQDLQKKGLLKTYAPFAGNQLIIAISKEGKQKVKTIKDLSAKDVRLVLAEENAPVGEYFRLSLEKMQNSGNYGEYFRENILANVVSNESSEQNVLAKVLLGEADAGVVYTSSLNTEVIKNQGVAILEIEPEMNVTAYYYLASFENAALGSINLVEWLNSNKGKSLMKEHGYLGGG